jgi:methylmalonyl-CoA mutase N-terminal domain/subunit
MRAIERGDVQREIQDSALRHQRLLESGDRVIVGVNRFVDDGDAISPEVLRIDPAVERDQAARVRALRLRRPERPWRAALTTLEEKARGGGDLTSAIVEAVMALATVGEVASRLRSVFGEHRELPVL